MPPTPNNADQSSAPDIPQELPTPLPPDPFPIFLGWFQDAHDAAQQPNPNAMSLATVSTDGSPSCRIVLCKQTHAGSADDPSHIVFYTNYTGGKAIHLENTPKAAATFHWDHADRQVRFEGLITRAPADQSEAYFRSRPWLSRVAAWASDQSRPVESRDALRDKLRETMRRFGIDPDSPPARDADPDIPRPPHWGGYRLYPHALELWVGSRHRLHDRARWTRTLTPDTDAPPRASAWSVTRLQP